MSRIIRQFNNYIKINGKTFCTNSNIIPKIISDLEDNKYKYPTIILKNYDNNHLLKKTIRNNQNILNIFNDLQIKFYTK